MNIWCDGSARPETDRSPAQEWDSVGRLTPTMFTCRLHSGHAQRSIYHFCTAAASLKSRFDISLSAICPFVFLGSTLQAF